MNELAVPGAGFGTDGLGPNPDATSQDAVSWQVVRSLPAMKYRIIRHTPQAIVGMILGAVLGGMLSFGLIGTILALVEHPSRGAILTVGGAGGLVLWFLAPLVMGGGELILDLRSLAVYPLNIRTLLAGLLLAAMVGIPFFYSLIVALAVVTHATSLLTAALLLVAAVQLAVTGVLAGRVSVGLVSLLTTTRFRSIAGGITIIAAITLGVGVQILSLAALDIKPEWFENIRPVIRVLPIGWTPEAMAYASLGQPGFSALFLGLGAGLLGLLLLAWKHIVRRQLDGQAAQSKITRSAPLVPGWMDRLVDRRTAAAWAKSIRSIRRDPREWTELAAFLPLVLAFSIPTLTELDTVQPNLVLVSFIAAASGATMVTTNLFGGDAGRFVTDVFPGDDFRPILVGKLLPRATLVGIIVLAATVLLAWLMQGWHHLTVSFVLVIQSLIIGSAAGVWVSIRSPIPLPDKVGGFNSANSGCVAPLYQIMTLFVADTVAIVFALPALLIALVVGGVAATGAALLSLALVVLIARRRVARLAVTTRNRIPVLAATLARRT